MITQEQFDDFSESLTEALAQDCDLSRSTYDNMHRNYPGTLSTAYSEGEYRASVKMLILVRKLIEDFNNVDNKIEVSSKNEV